MRSIKNSFANASFVAKRWNILVNLFGGANVATPLIQSLILFFLMEETKTKEKIRRYSKKIELLSKI